MAYCAVDLYFCSLRVFPPFPVGDYAFKFDNSLQESFRAWRATGYIDIDGQKLIGAEDDAVLPFEGKWTAGNRAVAKCHDPLGFRHLVVEGFDARHHFLGDGSSDDHDIALSGRRAKDLRTEAGHVEPGTAGGHHFDGTTGDTEG